MTGVTDNIVSTPNKLTDLLKLKLNTNYLHFLSNGMSQTEVSLECQINQVFNNILGFQTLFHHFLMVHTPINSWTNHENNYHIKEHFWHFKTTLIISI